MVMRGSEKVKGPPEGVRRAARDPENASGSSSPLRGPPATTTSVQLLCRQNQIIDSGSYYVSASDMAASNAIAVDFKEVSVRFLLCPQPGQQLMRIIEAVGRGQQPSRTHSRGRTNARGRCTRDRRRVVGGSCDARCRVCDSSLQAVGRLTVADAAAQSTSWLSVLGVTCQRSRAASALSLPVCAAYTALVGWSLSSEQSSLRWLSTATTTLSTRLCSKQRTRSSTLAGSKRIGQSVHLTSSLMGLKLRAGWSASTRSISRSRSTLNGSMSLASPCRPRTTCTPSSR